MSPDRYSKFVAEFDALVKHAQTVSDRLVGTAIVGKVRSYADAIYLKLLCHAVSLRKLSPSTDESVDDELWDVASASAVARALIESYDALAYIAVHRVNESEREFRVLLWELHDQQRRLRMLDRVWSVDARIPDMQRQAALSSAKLTAHSFFSTTTNELRAKVARGDAPPVHLSQRELNAMSGIDHDYYIAATMFLSQYVHTYPFSLHQLIEFRAGEPDALHLASMPLQYSMPFIAKAIEAVGVVWPEASLKEEEEAPTFRGWLRIAAEGVRRAG